ncbi:heparin lyase I family protein [Mycolicibacterium tokaiense]|nr:heparin lyase I family protein [Mycolicibacterium tokaiense]
MLLFFGPAGVVAASPVSFVGDYSTGDFSQWVAVQNESYAGRAGGFDSNSTASIVEDGKYGHAARFEVKPGDPNEHGTQRSEVMGGPETGGTEGEVMWYQFATKFHTDFPMNHADLGQGITNQWWGVSHAGPPLAWSVGKKNGYWSLQVQKQSAPGEYERSFTIFHTPLDVGNWHDVTMQIRWSASDDRGWIRLWHNGQRQTFVDGSDTFRVRTLIPDTKQSATKRAITGISLGTCPRGSSTMRVSGAAPKTHRSSTVAVPRSGHRFAPARVPASMPRTLGRTWVPKGIGTIRSSYPSTDGVSGHPS